MHAPDALLHLVAPWKELYSNSKAVDTGTVFLHIAALMFGGGTAIVADRATLRVRRPSDAAARTALHDLALTHRIVIAALAVSFITGIAMAAADLETFLASPIFAIKLSLVALLIINGALLTRTESALRGELASDENGEELWRRLRFSARASLVLWSATVLAGTALANMV